MKRLIIFLLAFTVCSGPALANNMEKSMRAMIEDLSRQYVQKYPVTVTRRGIAVLPFEEKSEQAEKHGLGETAREALARELGRSAAFFLVDRESLNASLKEQELSMTGLVKEADMIKAGDVAGVQVFLRGTVSEAAGKFIINARLIDAATGRVAATSVAEIESDLLIEKQKQYAYEYIAKYGLGVNFQTSMAPHIDSPRPNAHFSVTDAFINYRPRLWLNFKLGISYYMLRYGTEETKPAADLFPDLLNVGDRDYTSNDYQVHAKNGDMSEIAPYLGVDFNWSPATCFTLGIGVSAGFYSPDFTHIYNGLFTYDDEVDGTLDSYQDIKDAGGFIIEQEMGNVFTFRAELKPQYFISPRFTVGLYLAFMYTTPLRLQRATINSEYTISDMFSPNEDLDEKYLGINPKVLGIGHNIQDLKLISMLYGISLNFYF